MKDLLPFVDSSTFSLRPSHSLRSIEDSPFFLLPFFFSPSNTATTTMFAAFGFGGGGSTFSATYRVYPVSFLEKESAERGDKLILPPSALDRLGEFFPLFFFSNAAPLSPLSGSRWV